MKETLLILIGFCITNTVHSQSLDSLINHISRFKQIEYKVKKWSLKDSNIDTIFSFSNHSVYITKSDSLLGGYFRFDDAKKSEIYNGQEYIMIDKDKEVATIVNLKEAPEWKINSVFCSDSYLEMLKILNRAKNDKHIKLIESNNEIKISASNTAYDGRLENESGIRTEFDIKLFPKSYRPKYLTIKSYKEGKLTLNQGVKFYDLKTFSKPSNCYYKESIDSSTTLVEHRYIKNIQIGDIMPNWIIYAPNKNTKILLRELNKDNILLIEFWFTHCQYCIKSIPALTELQNRYKNSGFRVIYANNSNGSESDRDILDFKSKHNITFDIFKFGNIYEQGLTPTTILVDKNGIIRYKIEGYDENMIEEVEKILKNK